MKRKINISPKTTERDINISFTDKKLGVCTGAYVGMHSYVWNFIYKIIIIRITICKLIDFVASGMDLWLRYILPII